MTRIYRVTCFTCGWFNESLDKSWTRHAGVVHSTMLRPGHDVIGTDYYGEWGGNRD